MIGDGFVCRGKQLQETAATIGDMRRRYRRAADNLNSALMAATACHQRHSMPPFLSRPAMGLPMVAVGKAAAAFEVLDYLH